MAEYGIDQLHNSLLAKLASLADQGSLSLTWINFNPDMGK